MDKENNLEKEIKTIEAYIEQFPLEVQEKLILMRKTIKDTAPDAQEKISWEMPTYVLHGNLVHFAGNKKHIGFYPSPSGVENFSDELSEYKTSKGAIQFPLNQPLPIELIEKIVTFRVNENIRWAEEKQNKKNSNKNPNKNDKKSNNKE